MFCDIKKNNFFSKKVFVEKKKGITFAPAFGRNKKIKKVHWHIELTS
jgi:hypothetical protein